jgi:hypothetical protein
MGPVPHTECERIRRRGRRLIIEAAVPLLVGGSACPGSDQVRGFGEVGYLRPQGGTGWPPRADRLAGGAEMPALFVRAMPLITPRSFCRTLGEVSRWPDPLGMPGRRRGVLRVRSPGAGRSGVAVAVVRWCAVWCAGVRWCFCWLEIVECLRCVESFGGWNP